MCMLAVLQPGEEVALHEPCWVSYSEQARLCGGRARYIPHDVAPADFVKHLTPRTRMLILNNPNNPAGRLYTEQELRTVYEACASRGIYLLVDEAYSDFLLDETFTSAGKIAPSKEHLIIVNSLSKNMGISGWRIGVRHRPSRVHPSASQDQSASHYVRADYPADVLRQIFRRHPQAHPPAS